MNRPVARALGALTTASMALAVACGDGTSAWVLTRNHPSPPLASGATAGTSSAGLGGISSAGAGIIGGTSQSGEGGATAGSGSGGEDPAAAGSAGEGSLGPRDPDDFAEVCSPVVTIDNRTASGNGQLFNESLPEPETFMVAAARRSCALLYKLPAEVPSTTSTTDLTVVIEDFEGAPGTVAVGGTSTTLRLNSLHMRAIADAAGDVTLEVSGVSQFLIALDYVLDDGAAGWLVTGLADWVRFESGYTPLTSRGPGGTWADGFKTTAFFVDWLDESYVDAAYLLNRSMDPSDATEWSEQVFVDIAGKDVTTLWNDYQASL